MITINGKNFFGTSVVTIAPAGVAHAVNNVCTQSGTPTQVTSQSLSQTAMTATVNNAQNSLYQDGFLVHLRYESVAAKLSRPACSVYANRQPACSAHRLHFQRGFQLHGRYQFRNERSELPAVGETYRDRRRPRLGRANLNRAWSYLSSGRTWGQARRCSRRLAQFLQS